MKISNVVIVVILYVLSLWWLPSDGEFQPAHPHHHRHRHRHRHARAKAPARSANRRSAPASPPLPSSNDSSLTNITNSQIIDVSDIDLNKIIMTAVEDHPSNNTSESNPDTPAENESAMNASASAPPSIKNTAPGSSAGGNDTDTGGGGGNLNKTGGVVVETARALAINVSDINLGEMIEENVKAHPPSSNILESNADTQATGVEPDPSSPSNDDSSNVVNSADTGKESNEPAQAPASDTAPLDPSQIIMENESAMDPSAGVPASLENTVPDDTIQNPQHFPTNEVLYPPLQDNGVLEPAVGYPASGYQNNQYDNTYQGPFDSGNDQAQNPYGNEYNQAQNPYGNEYYQAQNPYGNEYNQAHNAYGNEYNQAQNAYGNEYNQAQNPYGNGYGNNSDDQYQANSNANPAANSNVHQNQQQSVGVSSQNNVAGNANNIAHSDNAFHAGYMRYDFQKEWVNNESQPCNNTVNTVDTAADNSSSMWIILLAVVLVRHINVNE